MSRYFVGSHVWKSFVKTVVWIMCLMFFAAVVDNASAITAQALMENVAEVYEDIDNYKAVVYTYQVDSMDVSESVFAAQEPIIAFNLFFRQPNAHAVEEIGQSRFGIFRIELLSTIGTLKDLELTLEGNDFILGQECYVLEISSIERPDELARLWVAPKTWRVLQFTISIASIDMVMTRFKYPLEGRHRILPVETRSFFPLSKQVLINRIANYQINTNLSPEIFKQRKPNQQAR